MLPVVWLESDRLLAGCTVVGCTLGQRGPGSSRSPGILREQQDRVRVNPRGNRIVDRVKIGAQEDKLPLLSKRLFLDHLGNLAFGEFAAGVLLSVCDDRHRYPHRAVIHRELSDALL